jgi:hypothetical protein
MVDRKIYSSWAFSDNEKEKSSTNYAIYKEELEPKAKQFYNNGEPTDEEKAQYACYKCVAYKYGHNKYQIISNPHNLSTLQLALICDGGNLCFGHSTESRNIIIYTD